MGTKYEEEIEIDLMDLLFELLAQWKKIAVSTVLVALIVFVYSKFIITPQYASTSALYVLSKSTSLTSLADIQMGTNLTNDYIVVVKGRPVLEQVITNLGLEENHKELDKKVTLNNPSDSRILQITVEDPDPNRAKSIADELAKVSSAYIAEKMDQDPPTIIQYGYADGDPVSPSVGKNTIIGAMVGMLLAIAMVVIGHLMNDTIMTAEDVERKLGMNLLGSLPEEETQEYDGKKRSSSKKKKPTKVKANPKRTA